jgi:secreted Zn-dependent insulinase-like peptidase
VFDAFILFKKWRDVELNDAFKMPKPNEFIATNFDIKPKNQEVNIMNMSKNMLAICVGCTLFLSFIFSEI